MESKEVVEALAALAQETRLDIFRLLVRVGPAGLPAGQIGEQLGLAPATLSFHLGALKRAHLLQCRRESRSLVYSADFPVMQGLVAFLTEHCCEGRPELCLPPNSCPSEESPP